uniref:Putative NADH dehydrogenase n=1 Tax=viral metagenome TaxID=1070528 RepID=A0A6H1ZY65_9ZZZZ
MKDSSESYLPLKADEFLRRDLRQPYSCFSATKDIDWVFNLSANMGGIGFITKVGAEVMHDNALININLLEACRLYDVKRMLFTSSACIYPTYRQENVNVKALKEEFALPANPDNYYGWEKLFTEKLMEAYKRDYGSDIRIARLHNVYGNCGTFMGGREKAPAALCRKAALAKDGDSIVVWGDGKQTRSFLYIDDCVNGLWMLMNSDCDKPLNIGSDRLVTIDELAKMIIAISGKNLRIKHDLSKPQGVRGRNADLSLVKQVIGWEPKVSLEEGLTQTYRWIEGMVKNG